MALIQGLHSSKLPSTFGQFAETVFSRLVALGTSFAAQRIDFVGDRYLEVSIKNVERKRRTENVQTITIYGPDQKLPRQWKKFLSSGKNKESLQRFLVNHWQHASYPHKVNLYVGIGNECKRLQFEPNIPPVVTHISALDSDHEKADT